MICQNNFLRLLVYLILCCCAFSLSHAFNASLITSSRVIRCVLEESSALLQLKLEFSFDRDPFNGGFGGYPKMKHWKAGTDCCKWDGVTCNTATGHVMGLDLSLSWLHGSLLSNSSLFGLHRLEKLNLAFNSLDSSQIPSTFGRLSRLTHLNISNANVVGYVPFEISRLTNLVSLDLSCLIYGGLRINTTTLIQNMTKLSILDLTKVLLSSVQVEKFLENSSSLTYLSLQLCSLQNTFPKHIFQLIGIEVINLSFNVNLTGYLPEFPFGSNLKSLVLTNTQFYGTLPDSIGNLRSLNVLILDGCNFLGAIPSSLWNLSQLTSLSVIANNLNGQLPSTLGNLYQLTHLSLSENKLNGPLPSTLGNLSQLTFLDLSRNNFTGQLPFTLGNLYQLTDLRLFLNNFIGQLPSTMGNLSQLTSLDLSVNNFNGQLPSTLGNLVNLTYLNLNSTGFGGELPSSIGNLTSLQRLHLQMNGFSGQIPHSFGNLVQLTELILDHNTLNGEFPIQVANLSQLLFLDVSHNHLRGSLPDLIGSSLRDELILSYNLFTGIIPPSLLSSCKNLRLDNNHFTSLPNLQNVSSSNMNLILDLRSNALQGSLIVPPPSTQYFFISENNLSGSLHQLFCNLTDLVMLDVSNNNLRGIIPQCLGSFSSYLEVLNMKGNNFHGEIPQTFLDGSSLRSLDLSRNQLHGMVPQSLINCRALEVLNLGHNQINDTFPFWLQNLPELQVLVLRSNKFYGPIWHPEKFLGFVKLRIVDLSFNNFSGNLPSDYFRNWTAINTKIPSANKSNLRYMEDRLGYYQESVVLMNKGLEMVYEKILTIFMSIDLSNNNFYGEIPSTVGDLQSLIVLNLSSNNFQGLIPSTLGNLVELQSLDLSSNKFSGRVPQELTSLTFLQYLNLSYNQLTGRVPHGNHFDTFPNSSYEGNLDLCGFPLSKKCDTSSEGTQSPDHGLSEESESESESESGNGFSWKVVLIGYGCGCVVGMLGAGYLRIPKKPDWLIRILRRQVR